MKKAPEQCSTGPSPWQEGDQGRGGGYLTTFRIPYGNGRCIAVLKGDISNAVRPRVLLVFEGALGFIDGDAVEEFNARAHEGLWATAWDQWTLHDMMGRKIWDVVKRQAVQVSLVTLLIPQEFCDAAADGLQTLMDAHGLPVSETIAMPVSRLVRELPFMPDVAAVYDANPETWGMYGRKGRALQNVNDFGRL